jgi:TetR/AcrR family transcriptional regulator, mexCD-oprJ operon repressor
MTAQRVTRYQREVATRNVEAILDAAEDLLRLQGHASISAVAARAGVSRVTVYGHFPTWSTLLEAAVERAVRHSMTAIDVAQPGDGPADEALERVIAAGWRYLSRYEALAKAVSETLSPDTVTHTHQAAHHTIGALVARGQDEGIFRTDLPADWLVHASIALMHACADGIRAGRIDAADAQRIVTVSVRDLFTGPRCD